MGLTSLVKHHEQQIDRLFDQLGVLRRHRSLRRSANFSIVRRTSNIVHRQTHFLMRLPWRARPDCTTIQQQRQPRKRRHTPRTASSTRVRTCSAAPRNARKHRKLTHRHHPASSPPPRPLPLSPRKARYNRNRTSYVVHRTWALLSASVVHRTSYMGSLRLPPARGEKTTRRVKRCNAPAGRKMIKMSCSGSLEHGEVRESREKFSPVACPLAGTGREATHNSRWYMRKRASITHSISRGLMAIALHLILIIFLCAGFCRTGSRIVPQPNRRGNHESDATLRAQLHAYASPRLRHRPAPL